MNLQDLEYLAKGLVPVMDDMIAEATAPLLARIADLEARAQPLAESDLEARIANGVRAAVVSLPKAEDGAPGRDADEAAVVAQVVARLEPTLADLVAARSVGAEEIERLVVAEVSKIPPPADGQSVAPETVAAMVDAAVGKAVKDPVGLAGAFQDHEGCLIVTLSNGEACNVGRVAGKDGQDGAPGRDGIGPSDFDTEVRDGGRTVLLKFTYGDVTEVHELDLGGLHDAGVYTEDAEFKTGAFVTFGGQAYIAQRATKAKPGESEDWRLAVKKGRDGRSLFDIARARGFTGNETQFVEHVIERALERKPLRFGPGGEGGQ